jgi:ADP-ribose pyrophosphatase
MYKYCPKCAGNLAEKNGYPVCQKCGFVFYQNSKPTSSSVIVNEKNETLLLKRAINPHFGKWDIAGGFLENGEDPVVGLKREAKEELGVSVEPLEVLNICVDNYGLAEDDFYTFNIFYKCKISDGEIVLDQENSEFKWFSKNEIPWNELAFDNTTIALRALFKVE